MSYRKQLTSVLLSCGNYTRLYVVFEVIMQVTLGFTWSSVCTGLVCRIQSYFLANWKYKALVMRGEHDCAIESIPQEHYKSACTTSPIPIRTDGHQIPAGRLPLFLSEISVCFVLLNLFPVAILVFIISICHQRLHMPPTTFPLD